MWIAPRLSSMWKKKLILHYYSLYFIYHYLYKIIQLKRFQGTQTSVLLSYQKKFFYKNCSINSALNFNVHIKKLNLNKSCIFIKIKYQIHLINYPVNNSNSLLIRSNKKKKKCSRFYLRIKKS